ncbi:DegV family protein [Mesoplasma corruscae]|uniref:Fatty acid-binding protein DegV n=1 Tax=Mesoplasma corruscae TaxID=216874 RepID=A0A2S5RHH9_9MOLU|nr:DegV family protein [Mesoplasma corruscae]PPE06748.1 fatty acid-binding protein DegV [Mesoplasma corruscae]
MKIGILIDSSSVYDPKIFEGTCVEVLPLHINLANDKDFLDNIENFKKYEVLKLLNDDGEAKTSQASPGEVEKKYDEMLKKYDHIIHIPLANNLSSMFQTSLMVANDEKFEGKVTIYFNEKMAAQVVERAVLRLSEKLKSFEIKNLKEVKAFLDDWYENCMTIFIPGDLKRMANSGRAKSMLVSVLSFLKVKVVMRWNSKPTKEGVFRTYSSVAEKISEIYLKEFGSNFKIVFARSELAKSKTIDLIRNEFNNKKIKFEEELMPNIFLVHGGVESLAFLVFRK